MNGHGKNTSGAGVRDVFDMIPSEVVCLIYEYDGCSHARYKMSNVFEELKERLRRRFGNKLYNISMYGSEIDEDCFYYPCEYLANMFYKRYEYHRQFYMKFGNPNGEKTDDSIWETFGKWL